MIRRSVHIASSALRVLHPWRLWRWIDVHVLSLGRQMRISYLPPLMVYLAAGVSGLTGIVGTFFVKDHLGLSAEFLAALGFWAGIPWALKMGVGHLVDLVWKWKSFLVVFGAALIGSSLAIMIGLLGHAAFMTRYLSVEAWFVWSVLLAPVGYMVQDVVADAMTVEAVPIVDDAGRPYSQEAIKLMHTTMQTLGRVATVGGGIVVSLVNIFMLKDADSFARDAKLALYTNIYTVALLIPAISVLGVISAALFKRLRTRKLRCLGLKAERAEELLKVHRDCVKPNWWIIGGSLGFGLFTLAMGVAHVPFNQEVIFVGSMTLILFLMARLVRELSPAARRALVGTAIIIFVFRALPGPGAGSTWWQIDELGFDEHFLSVLSLIGGSLALVGMFVFRRFMAEKSIAYVVGFLAVVGTLLSLPILGMYYGLHRWTAAMTGGLVDARFIAVVDTALESPLGQVAMIPMLAWIANSAPANLKATFFAVMASFTNLALSLSSLGTKYLNQVFTVTRAVLDPVTGTITLSARYGDLGPLLVTVTLLGFLLPFMSIFFVNCSPLRSR